MIYRKPATNAEVKAVDLLQRYDYPQSRTRNTLLLLASGVSWYRVRQRMRLSLDTDPEAFFLWAEGWAEGGFRARRKSLCRGDFSHLQTVDILSQMR